jgi:activator of HSP90 ATPase
VQKFSKSPAVLEAEKGGKFQMFDGNITGEYIELVSTHRLVSWDFVLPLVNTAVCPCCF